MRGEGSEQLEKVLQAQVGTVQNSGERSGGQTAVGRHNHLRIRIIAYEDNVASTLPMHAETGSAECRDHSSVR